MEAREFYNTRLEEDPTVSSVKLMEEYAKHVIQINFCDGSPTSFDDLTIKQLKKLHDNINLCVEWVNS